MATDRMGRFNSCMPRDADPYEIADLVARAERVKRNQEIVLRTFQPKPLSRPVSQAVVISLAREASPYLQIGDDDPDSET
jgi:hypothetical protein